MTIMFTAACATALLRCHAALAAPVARRHGQRSADARAQPHPPTVLMGRQPLVARLMLGLGLALGLGLGLELARAVVAPPVTREVGQTALMAMSAHSGRRLQAQLTPALAASSA